MKRDERTVHYKLNSYVCYELHQNINHQLFDIKLP